MRLSLMALTALTAALHLTAAAPTAAPTAKDGDFPKDMWIKKIEGDRIVADLGAGEGHSEQHWITVQTECQEIDRSPGHFPNGIEWIGMPDGYRCRLWESKSCNGNGTPDIKPKKGDSFYPIKNGQGHVLNSFKCYKNE